MSASSGRPKKSKVSSEQPRTRHRNNLAALSAIITMTESLTVHLIDDTGHGPTLSFVQIYTSPLYDRSLRSLLLKPEMSLYEDQTKAEELHQISPVVSWYLQDRIFIHLELQLNFFDNIILNNFRFAGVSAMVVRSSGPTAMYQKGSSKTQKFDLRRPLECPSAQLETISVWWYSSPRNPYRWHPTRLSSYAQWQGLPVASIMPVDSLSHHSQAPLLQRTPKRINSEACGTSARDSTPHTLQLLTFTCFQLRDSKLSLIFKKSPPWTTSADRVISSGTTQTAT